MRTFNLLALVLVTFVAQSAAELNACPSILLGEEQEFPSLNPQDQTYHCMHKWNPCTAPDLQNDKWPTWPEFEDGVRVVGPFYSEVTIVPSFGTGLELRLFHCDNSGTTEARLKPDWKVFDRELFAGDHATIGEDNGENGTDILSVATRIPNFSLYNTRTGVLRTFMLISDKVKSLATIAFDDFYTEGVITGKNSIASGYALLENGMSTGLPLSKAPGAGFTGWTSYAHATTTTNFWYVIDQVIPYNPWDNPAGLASSGLASSGDMYLTYGVITKLVQDVYLKGEMITQDLEQKPAPPRGIFKGNGYGAAVGKLANIGVGYLKSDGGQQAISGALGSVIGGLTAPAGTSGNLEAFQFLNSALSGISDNFGLEQGSVNDLLMGGISMAAGPIAGSLVSGLFFPGGDEQPRLTWHESKINLSGSIETQGRVGVVEIPFSRLNSLAVPYFFKGTNGHKREEEELGLFTLTGSPRIHLRRVDYIGTQPVTGKVKGLSSYHITVDDPLCDLVVNPTNGNHILRMQIAPVFWNKNSNSWDHKGIVANLSPSDGLINQTLWFESGEEELHNRENWATGVEIVVELASEDQGVAKPILVQRVFSADLEWDDNPVQVHFLWDIGKPFSVPENLKVVPVMEPSNTCSIGETYVLGKKIRNDILTTGRERSVAFEINTITGVDINAATDEPISVELNTCTLDEGVDQTWSYQLNTPHHNDFEIGDDATYIFSEQGKIGPIKTVKFRNKLPKTKKFLADKPGWLLASFAVRQRNILTSRLYVDEVLKDVNTYLAGEYECSKITLDCNLVGVQEYPGISFENPFAVYTYENPNWEQACKDWRADEHTKATVSPLAYVAPVGGKLLTISGKSFGSMKNLVKVFLGNIEVPVVRVIPQMVTISIPPMAKGQYAIKVVVDGQDATSTNAYVDIVDEKSADPPPVRPSFFSFDENPTSWHSLESTLSLDESNKIGNGGFSLAIEGDGYRVVRSKRFCATDLKTYGTKLAVDVFIPTNPSNPWWLGEVALLMDAPSAGVYNSWQGNFQLTGLSIGNWHTVEIPLNVQALAAMAGTDCDLEFGLVLNAASASGHYGFDNLRFTGTVLNSQSDPNADEPKSPGTGSSFVCSGNCLDAETAGNPWTPITLNTTGEKWYVLSTKPAGWQVSELAERTISINGEILAPSDVWPVPASDGKWYLRFSEGTKTWSSWSYWLY